MYDHVLAAGSHEPKSFLTYLTIGLVASALIAAGAIGLSMIPSSAGGQPDAERARLFTHSEAFWARWPNNRVFEAPYGELAAGASRCARLIGIFQRQRGTNLRPASGPTREVYDESNRQIATYQAMLNAMNYAVSQGRGPQLPSN